MIKNLTPRLAEAGKIKIGGLGTKRTSREGKEFRVPVKYDHFVITGTQRDTHGDLELDTALMDALEKGADGKLHAIPIVLHGDDIDSVFPTSYALYTGKKCACRGDGERATRREIKDKEFTGKEKEIVCPCDYLNADQGPKCKPNGKLYCSIAAPGSAVAGAVHIWRTTSIISIQQMIASLEQIKNVCGTLRGIPLWLLVRPVTVEPPGSGPITVYCCHVELRVSDIEEVQRRALERAKIRRALGGDDGAYRRMLTAPGDEETHEEMAEIEAEFYNTETGEVVVDPKAPAGPDDIREAIEGQADGPTPSAGVPYHDDEDDLY
jgi:hypothetical protein